MAPTADEQKKNIKPRRSLFRKIVNVFIGFFIVLLVLLVILFGFTQTKTFRELLREKVVEIANNELNGRLAIGKIDGTILTSLILRDVLLTQQQDTLLSAQKIEVKTSPLQILLDKIFVRSVLIENTTVNLIRDTAGVYNISRLFKPKVDEDTVKSKFGYQIIVSEFIINNASFRSASFENRKSNLQYATINSDDLRIDSLYLHLNAFADIAENFYHAEIESFSFKPNLTNFRLYNMKGDFELTNKYGRISDFSFNSNTTDFDLEASMDNFNLFEDFEMSKLKNSPVKVKIDARVFDFTDLTSYVSSTDIMKGSVKFRLDVGGKFGNMDINDLSLDYLQTHLNLEGNLKNLHTPEDLYIRAHIHNSQIHQPDIDKLLPVYKLPVYQGLYLRNIIIDYEGYPVNFTADLKTDLPEGYIEARSKFDFTSDKMKYDISFLTSRLNLNPVINTPTKLNLTAEVKGEGTSPDEMNSSVLLKLNNSVYNEFRIDSLRLTSRAQSGNINLLLNTIANDTRINLNGNLLYTDPDNPRYTLSGRINELDLNKLVSDTTLKSNLNFSFNLKGESFEPDNMTADFRLNLQKSMFNSKQIDSTRIDLAYHKNTAETRFIDFKSDFADFNLTGKFDLSKAIDLLSYQSDVITKTVMRKIYDFNPMALVSDTVEAAELGKRFEIQLEQPPVLNEDLDMKYRMEIKDFALVSLVTGFDQIDIDGIVSGRVSNNNKIFFSSILVDFEKLKLLTGSNIMYASNIYLDLDLGRENDSISFDNLTMNLKLTTDRVFSGNDLKNINIGMGLKSSVLNYSVAAEMDTTLKTELVGITDMSGNQFRFEISRLWADYMNFIWQNEGTMKGTYTRDYFIIDKFTLARNGSRINLSGSLYSDGKENLKLSVENLHTDMLNFLAGMDPNALSGTVNLEMLMNGYLHAPVIDLTLNMDSLAARNVKLGFLRSKMHYDNKLLITDIKFLDSTFNVNEPSLALEGRIPVDLSLVGAKERVIQGQPINVELRSNNFFLSTFAPFVPVVANLNGKLISDIKISGTTDNIDYAGNIRITEGSFHSTFNNMPYEMELNISLAQEQITIENLTLMNARKTDYRGALTGTGNIKFDGLSPQSAQMTMKGDLKVLSRATEAVLPMFYGDLVVQSDGDWRFTYENGQANLEGVALLVNTDVTYNAVYQTAYSGEDDFVYRYIPDTAKVDVKQQEFKDVVSLSRRYSPIRPPQKQKTFDLNYNLRVKIQDDANVRVILNREANQGLTLVMDGQLVLGKGGLAQGKFNLLDGSELQFIKTLSAEGSVLFESELTNPRLDITAIYLSEYTPPGTQGETDVEPELVEVRIKINSTLEKLNENLAGTEDNIAVYEGEENIRNDVPSPQRSSVDAIAFIITGYFSDELGAWFGDGNTGNGSGLFSGYGTSILGGLLSGFANSQFGDVVRNIELEQGQNNETRFNLSGRYQNVRYTIGSSTEQYTDVSKANIKIEYPVNERFIIRFERKEPISSTTTNLQDRITEFALRYRFIF